MGYMVYFQTIKSEDFINSPYNSRQDTFADRVVRGKIMSADGKVLAETVVDAAGNETRKYPYGNMYAHVVGFSTNGKSGIESNMNFNLLRSHSFVLERMFNEIKDEKSMGDNVVTTLDSTLQEAAYQALGNYDGAVVVMEPSTGKVLAMVSKPDFDPNTIAADWDSIISEDNNNSVLLNRATQGLYPPGSTFKIITAATGLEEGIVTTDNRGDFYCAGSEQVSSVTMNCWRHNNPHGSESLRDALANSCNPAFIQLGRKIGAKTLYKYYRAFGLFNRTNPYFYGESNSVFFPENNINEFNVATMSFGQRFTITPIQLITAVSSIANEGVLMQPRIVKEIKNTDTNSVTTVEPKEIRQVVSKETADKLMDMLEYVVAEGTGKYARVQGYSVGGKTGTSEPLSGSEDEGYVASFIGLAPTVNTQVVVLVTIYNPKGDSYQGSQVAGPVVSQILSEVLPYLGIPSNNEIASSSTNSTYTTTTLPDVTGKTIAEARQILKDAGFSVKISSDEDASTTVITDQLPKPGVSLIKNSTVHLFTEKSNERTETTIPNFKGMSAASAINSAEASNLNLVINGSGIVIAQDVASGKTVEQGTVVTLTLQQETGGY